MKTLDLILFSAKNCFFWKQSHIGIVVSGRDIYTLDYKKNYIWESNGDFIELDQRLKDFDGKIELRQFRYPLTKEHIVKLNEIYKKRPILNKNLIQYIYSKLNISNYSFNFFDDLIPFLDPPQEI